MHNIKLAYHEIIQEELLHILQDLDPSLYLKNRSNWVRIQAALNGLHPFSRGETSWHIWKDIPRKNMGISGGYETN